MKGKTLENIVLGLGVLVIGAAIFLMYIDSSGIAAKKVNFIFSAGFIIYIAYSYILSNNLNGEISALGKHVNNLKEEVGRQKATIANRDQSITQLNVDVNDLTAKLTETQTELASKTEALDLATAELTELKKDAEKEG